MIKLTQLSPACDNCRKHKLKCSRTIPHCKPCIKNERKCTYQHKPQKRGPKPKNLKKLDLKWHKPNLGLHVFSALSSEEASLSSDEQAEGNPMFLNFQLPSNVLPASSPTYNSTTTSVLLSNCTNSPTSTCIETEYLDLRSRLYSRLHTFISIDQIEIVCYYFAFINPNIELVDLEDFVEEFCFASSMPAFLFLIHTIQVITDLYINNQAEFLAGFAQLSVQLQTGCELDKDPALAAGSKLQKLANFSISNSNLNFLVKEDSYSANQPNLF